MLLNTVRSGGARLISENSNSYPSCLFSRRSCSVNDLHTVGCFLHLLVPQNRKIVISTHWVLAALPPLSSVQQSTLNNEFILGAADKTVVANKQATPSAGSCVS